MNYNLLFVLALFIAIWQTILFIGNALEKIFNHYWKVKFLLETLLKNTDCL